MKKNRNYVFFIIMILIFYGIFLFGETRFQNKGENPVITVPNSPLIVSVSANEKKLLSDVSALDNEDGNLTSDIFIESISSFDENQFRTITYAVLDSDDNITRTTRKIQYSDYRQPEITITQALCIYYLESTDSLKDYVKATSCVDGDISSQISIDKADYKGEDFDVTYSVRDSCGIKATLTTHVTILSSINNININLSQYMLKVEKGQEILPKQYIESIEIMKTIDESLIRQVKVSDNYDSSKEGIYEFIYRIEENGEIGVTKLVIIVEGE